MTNFIRNILFFFFKFRSDYSLSWHFISEITVPTKNCYCFQAIFLKASLKLQYNESLMKDFIFRGSRKVSVANLKKIVQLPIRSQEHPKVVSFYIRARRRKKLSISWKIGAVVDRTAVLLLSKAGPWELTKILLNQFSIYCKKKIFCDIFKGLSIWMTWYWNKIRTKTKDYTKKWKTMKNIF